MLPLLSRTMLLMARQIPLPPLPSADTIDVPYLPSVILVAARLPLSDVAGERLRLMMYCEGRYQGCSATQDFIADGFTAASSMPGEGLAPDEMRVAIRSGSRSSAPEHRRDKATPTARGLDL